jgi:signal transduction histidine kinase
MQEGVFTLQTAPFNPNEVLVYIHDVFQPQAAARGIELKTSVWLDLRPPKSELHETYGKTKAVSLPTLIGDQRRFKQVLINLVKNALKFTKKGSIEIKAGYNLQLQSIVVHVEDTGVGIKQEDLSLLFTRFGKLLRTAEMNSDGIGLGLTIVKQILEQGNGQIEVVSAGRDKGSCFLFNM